MAAFTSHTHTNTHTRMHKNIHTSHDTFNFFVFYVQFQFQFLCTFNFNFNFNFISNWLAIRSLLPQALSVFRSCFKLCDVFKVFCTSSWSAICSLLRQVPSVSNEDTVDPWCSCVRMRVTLCSGVCPHVFLHVNVQAKRVLTCRTRVCVSIF